MSCWTLSQHDIYRSGHVGPLLDRHLLQCSDTCMRRSHPLEPVARSFINHPTTVCLEHLERELLELFVIKFPGLTSKLSCLYTALRDMECDPVVHISRPLFDIQTYMYRVISITKSRSISVNLFKFGNDVCLVKVSPGNMVSLTRRSVQCSPSIIVRLRRPLGKFRASY